MKMKKIVSIAVSAALLVSMAAATAFAVESTPSKTGSDADSGETEVTEDLYVEAKATEASAAEESALRSQGVVGYLGASASSAAQILGVSTDEITINEIKELTVSGYDADMKNVTFKVPFAALPAAGTRVAVLVRVKNVGDVVVEGVVVEDTVTANGTTTKVRKVQFSLDNAAIASVQAGTAFVAAVTVK